MNTDSIACLYFSPTGTTGQIARQVAQGTGIKKIVDFDMTQRHGATLEDVTKAVDLILIATPVYYGRVPEAVADRLAQLKSIKKPVVLIVVYGNRAYDDALIELHDLAQSGGMFPVAGAAFIGQHSYSSVNTPIALGRPDQSDIEQAQAFGHAIGEKIRLVKSTDDLPAITIPGHTPYVEPINLIKLKEARLTQPMTPEVNLKRCNECGKCADACPTGAIVFYDPTQTDRWKCSLCMACVHACPMGARKMTDPNFKAKVEMLHNNCKTRREPELYL